VGGNNSVGTLLLLMAVGLLFLAFSRGRRQRREALGVQRRLAPGTEVMTTSGLYATVVAVEGDALTLETGPGQRSRWDKRAVARIITSAGASTVQDPADGADTFRDDEDARRTDEEEPPGRE
jgi:preprotein translocase subunit YajC